MILLILYDFAYPFIFGAKIKCEYYNDVTNVYIFCYNRFFFMLAVFHASMNGASYFLVM